MEYTPKEQKEHRKALVVALRSGKYEQGLQCLRSKSGKYCCLGVACDISGLAPWKPIYDSYTFMGKDVSMPKQVMDYFGFVSREGRFCAENELEHLTILNDKGISFEHIAGIIEQEPPGMFK